jgi:hypothetical protein
MSTIAWSLSNSGFPRPPDAHPQLLAHEVVQAQGQ